MIAVTQSLSTWINQQMRINGLSSRALARKAVISHSVVARMANGQGPFSARSLNAVADVLGVPREEVQRLAGLLRDNTPSGEVAELVARLEAMPEDLRQDTLDLFNALISYRRRSAPSVEDRLAAFRAAFAALTDEEQDAALAELRELLPAGQ